MQSAAANLSLQQLLLSRDTIPISCQKATLDITALVVNSIIFGH